MLTEILDRFDSMEAAIESAAAISASASKTFLSPADVASYLGVTEDVARQFVERYGIDKIQLTDDPSVWVVFRADIDDALGAD
jgi:hypothetical protein